VGGGDVPSLAEVLGVGNYANISINLDVVGEGAVINFTDGNPDSGGEIQGSLFGGGNNFQYKNAFTDSFINFQLPDSGSSTLTAPETISGETIATREWVEDNVGGGIESVTGDGVDNTDPLNPVINCIPLSGTEVGNPVTGDIEMSGDPIRIFLKEGDREQIIQFNKDADSIDILISPDGGITATNFAFTHNLGISISEYLGANYNDTTYVQKKYVDDTLQNAIITVELIDSLEVDFYATDDLKINSFTLIVGSGTITIEVNDSSYTLGTVINQGDKITVSTTTASVVNLIGKYE